MEIPDMSPYTLRYRDQDRLEVDVPQGHSINRLFEQLTAAGIKVTSLRNKTNRLEEFFLRLVHSKSEEQA